MITFAPSSPKRLAIAAPKPELAPWVGQCAGVMGVGCGRTGDDGDFALQSGALLGRHSGV